MCPFPYSFPFYFDPIPAAGLIDHQADHSVIPYIKLELTKTGSTSYNIYINPLAWLDVHLDPYKDYGEFYLKNGDQAWTDIDLLGYQIVYNFGLTIDGVSSSIALAPQKVTEMAFASQKGIAVCQVTSKGKISLLREDHASAEYWGSGSAKELVDQILKATLAPYAHCEAYEVVWHGDTGLDGINVFSPSDSFFIGVNTSRFDAVHTLLNMGNSLMRVEDDGKVHIRVPTTSGYTAMRTFSLDEHVFFWINHRDSLVMPNAVKVSGQNSNAEIIWDKITGLPYYITGPANFTGTATYTDSYDLFPVWHYMEANGLTSNDEATNMAQGILDGFVQSQYRGAMEVPINFYADLYDYIRIEDKRMGTLLLTQGDS